MSKRTDDFGPPGWFIVAWIFSALLSLAVLAFLGWALYRVVVHFT
jgi:hypothetical protein